MTAAARCWPNSRSSTARCPLFSAEFYYWTSILLCPRICDMGKFAAMLCLATCALAQTGTVEGDWQGTLSAGSLKIRIGLHVSKDAAGNLTAKVDSIDQSVMGIAVKTVTLKGNRLTLDIPAMHGGFEGTLNTDGSQIAGTLTQGAALPLTFKRVDKVATLNRPQEPKPPFPYDAV